MWGLLLTFINVLQAIFLLVEQWHNHECFQPSMDLNPSGVTREEVLLSEQSVLDTWKPEYNIQPNATSSAGRVLTVHKTKIALARPS